jgi:acyl-coenzyme A synthetase/AMP-(fatty) acid ligase
VIATGTGIDASLVAFVVLAGGAKLSIVDAKQICAAWLPRYMIVDRIKVVDELPRTGNGKIDRHQLATRLET